MCLLTHFSRHRMPADTSCVLLVKKKRALHLLPCLGDSQQNFMDSSEIRFAAMLSLPWSRTVPLWQPVKCPSMALKKHGVSICLSQRFFLKPCMRTKNGSVSMCTATNTRYVLCHSKEAKLATTQPMYFCPYCLGSVLVEFNIVDVCITTTSAAKSCRLVAHPPLAFPTMSDCAAPLKCGPIWTVSARFYIFLV